MSVERFEADDVLVRIKVQTSGITAVCCPGCGVFARRVHGRYVRRVADCAPGGRAVCIEVSARRMYCGNEHCPRATFAEQVEGLTERYQRRSPGLRRLLEAIAVALAGRAGARLARLLGCPVSGATLLNLVMNIPDPPTAVPRVLGVDDLALRRGQSYATLLVDCESHLPIGLRAGRGAGPLTAWLREHRGVEAVCRDGSSGYRAGITAGRRLADSAMGEQPVHTRPQVRRLHCDAPGCPRRTFAEQIPGLTTRYGRRTAAARRALESIAVAPTSRAGARLTARLRARL